MKRSGKPLELGHWCVAPSPPELHFEGAFGVTVLAYVIYGLVVLVQASPYFFWLCTCVHLCEKVVVCATCT
jgi:hypothetical protein